MISLSDQIKDEFQQIDLSALENHDEEKIKRGKMLDPDWNKFKVFYEDLKSEQKETDSFKEMFDLIEEETPVFEQFGEKPSAKKEAQEDKAESDQAESISQEEVKEPGHESLDDKADELKKEDLENIKEKAIPKLTPEQEYEKAFEDGKRDGYEKGFEQGKKEGHEKGMETGHAEGYEKGESKAAKDIELKIGEKEEDFKEMLSKLDNTYHELAERYEEKIISLICKISEKVILARVEIDDEIVKETVLDALKTLPEPEDITLTVSIEDYEYIEMVKEDLFEFIKTLKTVSVLSDTSIKRGGCRIETKEGYVKADIEEKLEKVFLSIKGNNQK